MTDLNSAQWQTQIAQDANAIILDVRTPEELEEGYIPDAVHLDIYQGAAFMEAIKEFDPQKNYYVYCRSGGRSAQACAILESIGVSTTYNLAGGFSEWDGAVTN